MLEESALGEFWDQWQELVTKVERIKEGGRRMVESYTEKMSDELIHLKQRGSSLCEKNGGLYWGQVLFL